MKYETAGDPVGDLKWTRRTTRKIADALGKVDIHVSKNTVGRLLKSIDFRLRVNHKKRSTTSPPERDAQFRYTPIFADCLKLTFCHLQATQESLYAS